MAPFDVEPIAEMERESPSPWTPAQIAGELVYSGSIALVAVSPEGNLYGWCCARYLGDEAELLKIAVRSEKRRSGTGDLLLETLQVLLAAKGIMNIFLEVRSRNMPALQLYRKHGFKVVGERPGYYSNPKDDALICQLHASCG